MVLRLNRRSLLTTGAASFAVLAAPGIVRAQAAPSFKIGALNSITGVGQPYGPGMQRMIQAGAEMLNNAAGGAGGRRIEVFAADDQSLPEPAVLAARRLAGVNGVNAIFGTLNSPATLAVMNAVSLPNKLIHTHVSGAEELFTNTQGLVFKFGQSAGVYGRIYAKFAAEENFRRPVVMQLNNDSARALGTAFVQSWQARGNAAPPRVVYEGQRPTYRSELQTALRNNPDVIILAAYLEDSAIILREWYQTGIPVKFIVAPYSLDQKLIDAMGNDVMQGLYYGAAQLSEDSPAFREYDAAYRRVLNQPGNSNRYGSMCWDMMNIVALALEAAGPNASNEQVAAKFTEVTNEPGIPVNGFAEGREALRRGKIKYVGASSPLHFDERGVDTASTFVINVIENGQRRFVRAVTEA